MNLSRRDLWDEVKDFVVYKKRSS